MKILVAGANGQIGYYLNKLLANTQYDFIALTRDQLDICNIVAVTKIALEFQPDIIINAAAYTSVDKAESDREQAFKINSDGARNLAEIANKIDAAIFHLSTDYVFAGDAEQPYKEDAPVAPLGVYGASKLKGEEEVVKVNSRHIIMRTSWVFGEHGNNFVKTMIRMGHDRERLRIVSDQWGGPTYAGDVASALLTIAAHYEKNKNLPWGIYHYSGRPYLNWYDFAKKILSVANQLGVIRGEIALEKSDSSDQRVKRPLNSRLDCKKIEQHFSIAPSNWQASLEKVIFAGEGI